MCKTRCSARGVAARIYGPQKGLRPEDFPLAEKCLRQLAKVTARFPHIPSFSPTGGEGARRADEWDPAIQLGAGAAGGLGFGLCVFLGARLESGFELFARMADLTGFAWNGRIWSSSPAKDPLTVTRRQLGKGVGELARRCRERNLPCIGLAGQVVPSRSRKQNWFASRHGLTELTTANNAKAKPALWLETLAAGVAANPTIQSLRARPQAG